MEIPGRRQRDKDFAERLRILSADRRAQLRELLGSPPDVRKVPASFWAQLEAEARQEGILAIYLMFLESAEFHADEAGGLDAETRLLLDGAAMGYATQRGAELGKRFAGGAQDQLERSLRTLEEEIARGEMTKREIADRLDEELDKSLGDSRADNTAQNYNTGAQTAGGERGIEETEGISDEDTWSTNPEQSRSGPCPNCTALNGKKRPEWGSTPLPEPEGVQYDPADGPLLHDGCCCEIIYARVPARGRT